MMTLTERAQFLIDNLDLPAASGVDDARWEHFQLALWSDDSTFRIETKSRQIAWSWAIAADAIGSMALEERDSIFISINQDEAMEKIRYARAIYENLRIGGLPRISRDTLTELEFSNGVRITSLPSKPARGRARANVYLDEFAHAREDRHIYIGTLPVTSKGGRLRIGSSPFGASGIFWEIYDEKIRPYPGYTRKRTPWWEIYAFCISVKEARKQAPALLTDERVEQYGNERILAIFQNMPLEDFQQEYEAAFVDETTAWITWEEIKAAQDPALNCRLVTCTGTIKPSISEAIDAIRQEIVRGRVEQSFALGGDIGRTRNTTEFYLIGLSSTNTFPLRLGVTLDSIEFDDQLSVLLMLLDRLPIAVAFLDQTGIGRNLSENAARYHPSKVRGLDFTNATKAQWATNAKMLIQQRKTPLPVDRDIAYQIHSIKKLLTAGRNLAFDTERNEKHHADKFWAWALGLAAAKDALMFTEGDDLLAEISRWN